MDKIEIEIAPMYEIPARMTLIDSILQHTTGMTFYIFWPREKCAAIKTPLSINHHQHTNPEMIDISIHAPKSRNGFSQLPNLSVFACYQTCLFSPWLKCRLLALNATSLTLVHQLHPIPLQAAWFCATLANSSILLGLGAASAVSR